VSKLARWWEAISLRTKITGVTVLLLTAGLVVAGFGTVTVLRSYLIEQVDRQLANALSDIGLTQGFSLDQAETYFQNDPSPLNPYYLAVVSSDGTLLDDNLGSSPKIRPNWSLVDLAETVSRGATVRSVDRGTQWRLLLTPVSVTDADTGTSAVATLVIGADLQEADETVARFGAVFLFFAFTVVILGGALTRLLADRTFSPLRRLEGQAARFADGDYDQRLDQAPPNTEVGRLTRSLNTMLTRIDAALADRTRTIEQMRRFVGDASHELRTPLVTVRGYAELYRMGAIADPADVGQAMERIEKEAVRMGGLVEDLLELARLDAAAAEGAVSGTSARFAPVDLVPLANDAARDAMAGAPDRTVVVIGLDPEVIAARSGGSNPQPAASATTAAAAALPRVAARPATPAPRPTTSRSAGRTAAADLRGTRPIPILGRLLNRRTPTTSVPVPVQPELPAPAPDLDAIVLGDEDKIRQVLANLITNAIRYTPEASPLEIGVGVDPPTRRGVVAVVDHGEGVPPQLRSKIFQRFWRADTSRTRETGGSGLGLAIVHAIVRAHHGVVDVVETPGGGATFRVFLPLA